jgi:glutamine---fructose-6-phosphate transaminase (isomerizing)
MKSCAMLNDILRQPESLRSAWRHQFGAGLEPLLEAGRRIRAAKRVIFTGMGGSLFAAMPAVIWLEQQGIAAEYIETAELLHFRHAALNSQTAVVVISRSGESVESVKLLPVLKAAGTAVIGVTNVESSTLFREAPLSLLFHCENDRMVAVQSYTSSVAVLMLLAASIRSEAIDSYAKAIDGLCEKLNPAIDRAVESAEEWVEFCLSGHGIYCLGRGPSLGSAHAAALLFHEASRIPAAALSTAQYRHGPVEVTDFETRVILFPSPGQTRRLDLALGADLERMGARVRICESNGVADVFAPIVEIVPVQAGVCALALHKGIDPGDFRYATLVTATETGFGSH